MASKVPERKLRGCDAITVEIELNMLATKPLSQLAPGNVADLIALESLEELAPNLRVRLKNFTERMVRSFQDLPSADFRGFVAALLELPAERVPERLRTVLASVAEDRRNDADAKAVSDAQLVWDEAPAEDFAFGGPSKIQQVVEAPRRRERASGAPKRSGAGRSSAGPRAPKKAKPSGPGSEAVLWVQQTVHQRLAGAGSAGLIEAVLLAGVVHRARNAFPKLQPADVRDVLRQMEGRGEVRSSAGRWFSKRGRF